MERLVQCTAITFKIADFSQELRQLATPLKFKFYLLISAAHINFKIVTADRRKTKAYIKFNHTLQM